MIRIALLVCCWFSAFSSIAGKKNWYLSFSACGGLPVFRATTEPDNFYLKNYDAGAGFNIAGYYRSNGGWQFGLLTSVNALFTNRKNTAASIVQRYSGPDFLNKVAIGGDPGIVSLLAEFGKVFKTGKWRFTPFFRSSILYSSPVSSHDNFYLKQKSPNEHYYKETRWQFSDSVQQLRFAPLQLTGGLRVAYQLRENYELYIATQYHFGTITLEGVKQESDFYSVRHTETFRLQQQYSLLGIEIGMQFRLFRD
jgi:hypothetical protein